MYYSYKLLESCLRLSRARLVFRVRFLVGGGGGWDTLVLGGKTLTRGGSRGGGSLKPADRELLVR